jgi:Domain of unknown function (DUF1841)
MLMQPSQADVRRFFCSVYAKFVQGAHLEPLEVIASQWMQEHTEYAADFADVALALQTVYDVDGAQTNPFLHLSMHLSITEQCSIDQPSGIRQAVELLTARSGDLHEAHHEVMEELGVMVWESQRNAQPPNGQAYVERVQQRATRD